ncbi:MAG: Eco57I restriction-modification methylase domain-containing protein [Bacteroidetes bacterium]|nr:Eco57I restriction-modification methylase domain-containing protein [Bacteroidota bacterium]
MQKIIDSIKSDFRTEIGNNDPKQIKLRKLSGDLYNLLNQGKLFELDSKQKKKQKENQVKLEADITILAKEIEEIKNNVIYKSAFEWRFEFPEVLNNNGEFEGFDAIIGNPPYIGEKGHKEVFRIIRQGNLSNFYQRKMDIFYFFFHLGLQLLKENGKLAYITTNYYLTSDGGENLRTDFKIVLP